MTQPQTFICEDIAIKIFLRLPLKSLLRFQCLSKSFESLISNPTFVKSLLQRSQKSINLLFKFHGYYRSFSMVNDKSLSTIVEDFDFGSELKSKYKVVGSCNGLVCLIAEDNFKRSTKYSVCLWNPSTKSLSYKPSLLVRSRSSSPSCSMFGFGYDSLSDTYKVVVVNVKISNNYESSLEYEVNVYNKRDNCWRKIKKFPGSGIVTRNPGMYLNGTINWLATSKLDWEWNNPLYIVSLDLGNKTYKQLSLPSCFDRSRRVNRFQAKPSLEILNEHLCFSYDDIERTQFVLWQMDEYGVESSWTQLLKLSYEALQIDQECILSRSRTFNNVYYLILIELVEGRLQTTILDKQEANTEIPTNKLWLYTKDYVPSLVAP